MSINEIIGKMTIDEKIRFVCFDKLTGGKVDTYQLMELLEPVNRERRHM